MRAGVLTLFTQLTGSARPPVAGERMNPPSQFVHAPVTPHSLLRSPKAHMSRRDITRKSSHFLAFPLYTNENLRRVVNDFQTELLSDKVAVKGLDKTIVVNPWRLHITVGVVGLEEDVGASEGPRYTVESALKLLESLHPSIDKILGGGQLEVDLDKLDVTQVASGGPRDEKFAHVLFVGPHKRNETLQNVMDLVYDTFKNQGYITESRSSKIHCTILNTRYRQPRERRPFSYSGVLKSQACKHFKMMRLSPSQGEQATTARRVQLGAFELGEIQLWKMGSHWENDKYFSHGGISWAKNKPNKIQKGGKCQGLTQSEIVVETKNGPLLGAGTNQNRWDMSKSVAKSHSVLCGLC
ncbi:hypothetical protein FRC12_011027 [Ceratobasidium sp. 428]|nr:hypothetical protein FRC12_011027 [Ceratobasidium sp. 428]